MRAFRPTLNSALRPAHCVRVCVGPLDRNVGASGCAVSLGKVSMLERLTVMDAYGGLFISEGGSGGVLLNIGRTGQQKHPRVNGEMYFSELKVALEFKQLCPSPRVF